MYIDKQCKIHGSTLYRLEKSGSRCCACERERKLTLARKKKADLVAYKGGGCENCGYNKSMSALVFHHIDPSSKSFDISEKLRCNYTLILNEVDKCSLLCANCHAELHEDETNKNLLVN